MTDSPKSQRRLAPLVAIALAVSYGRAEALVIESATRPDFAMHEWKFVRYDHNGNHPGDVGGNPGELSSVTKTDWDINFTYGYDTSVEYPCSGTDHCCGEHHHCGPARTTITVKSFKINGRQKTTVYVPKDAPKPLQEHEQAHFDINAYTYDQAFYRSRDFSRRMLRRTFTAETEEQCKSQLNDAFNHDFKDPYARWRDDLHQALNDLDGNGRGNGMKPRDAYRQVIKQHG